MLKLMQKVEFKESDFDSDGNIKASSLMYEFQEIAAAHATSLGLGFEDMMASNTIWVMTKLRFGILEKIKLGRTYVLETYPRPRKGISFFRDYYLYDMEEGSMENPAAISSSQWCVINFETRKIERAKIDFEGEFIKSEPFEDGIGKIRSNEPKLKGRHMVIESDMDINNHVNNCRYADMIEDVVGSREYKDFTIHFSKEAHLGDELFIFTESTGEEGIIVTGKLEDETIIFQSKIM